MLQTTVRRALTSGFAGQLLEDGPRRARPARITSPSIDGVSTNKMGRAFTYNGTVLLPAAAQGTAYEATVELGGAGQFFGVLGNPYSYALYGGGGAGGALEADDSLPFGALGEFFDMATALCVEIFNEKNTPITNHFGDHIAYATKFITGIGTPNGGLIALEDPADLPVDHVLIPNARLVRTFDMPGSQPGVPVSMLSVIQLTQ